MTGDRIAATLIFFAALLYLRESLNFRGVAVGDVLGPAAYPALIGTLVALLAVMQWVRSRPTPAATQDAFWHQHRRAAVLGAYLLAYVLLLEPVGVLVSTFTFLLLSHIWLGERRWLRAAATGLAITIALWLLFDRLLHANLPAGILGSLR